MKHAFLITAYQHHDQLRVLLQLLDHQDCDIYVHVDKADTTFDESAFTGVCRRSRVTFIPRRGAIIPRFWLRWTCYRKRYSKENMIISTCYPARIYRLSRWVKSWPSSNNIRAKFLLIVTMKNMMRIHYGLVYGMMFFTRFKSMWGKVDPLSRDVAG